ncbi:rho guanine nucleotide exchange factor 33 isoform X2 [Eucyclogobius newberryi]|uniref:rho guanine nucleotide exchange factor 33 isoform X2 n=1 Tax=Eucyclogobius newberryi TaxID=166745 RepID=UPI003B58F469
MEDGKAQRCTEDEAEMGQEEPEDCEENEQNGSLEISQLQGLVVQLRDGLHAALTELCELRQRDHSLEEQLQAHQTDVDDKIMSLKNSLNTFKEELSTTLFHIKEMSSRQREIHRRIELLQLENTKDAISTPHSRKNSKADVLAASGEDHICVPSQSDLSVIQHYLSSLPHNTSSPRSNTSTHTSTSEPEPQQQRAHGWGERKNSRDEGDNTNKNNKRQRAALELLESERVYVSHLSLLLKANISFNGSDALTTKDKRSFPSSLRFLIQQHLELLHTLQERVLKCQWQGIMGDVFMRLTSKESDFLDVYVSYLKELPDCLTVISMVTSGSIKSSLLESDILGDESKPSLYSLLLQPVQRIPEYLLLLQGLLRQTEAEHPDYFLLLVSIQQFRSFTAQFHHLLQHNQELLLHSRKEIKRTSMKQLLKTVESGGVQTNTIGSPYPASSAVLEHAKRNKQRLLEQMQSCRFPDWDRDLDPDCYEPEWASQLPFLNSEMDSRIHKTPGLGSIPESEASCQHRGTPHQGTDALGEYLLPPDPPGMESLYEEERSLLHDVSMFDRCSSASSDSSIDIAFVKCPKGPSTAHRAVAVNVPSPRDLYDNGVGSGHEYRKLLNRGYVSPDEAILMRRNLSRPLQGSQRKSKSLNGLQLENTVSGIDNGHLSDNLQRGGLGSHAKLERQSSKGSKGCPTPSRKVPTPQVTKVETDKPSDDMHGLPSIDSALQSWGEDLKWRGDEGNHTPFSERSRKQDKGGFRSSFKRLFKKKNSDEKKEKTSDCLHGEHEKPTKLVHLEITRGTAV